MPRQASAKQKSKNSKGNFMALQLRRVVTGHDENGKARVAIDEIVSNVISRRPGQDSVVVWASEKLPADLTNFNDISSDVGKSTVPGGSVFRICRYEPGVSPRNHRTESIDYAVVVSGEIDMELDDGVKVHLKAGDVVVQRGTVHNWTNNGDVPCVVAFVLVAANLPDGLESIG
jgi:quercetin dioxygenase-like cupin family protein